MEKAASFVTGLALKHTENGKFTKLSFANAKAILLFEKSRLQFRARPKKISDRRKSISTSRRPTKEGARLAQN
jgi:hypothetical protein